MSKIATTDHPIHEIFAQRWSPYAFSSRTVSREDLRSIFEAARWAASSYNEQPWRFIVADKSDEENYEKLLSCLVEANQEWASAAPVLALGIIAENFSRNDKPNGSAEHDLGLAAANLSLEATARGIAVHQMGGIVPDTARTLFNIPEGYRAKTGIAIGYAADLQDLSEEMKEKETSPRERKSLDEIVFSGTWASPADILVDEES